MSMTLADAITRAWNGRSNKFSIIKTDDYRPNWEYATHFSMEGNDTQNLIILRMIRSIPNMFGVYRNEIDLPIFSLAILINLSGLYIYLYEDVDTGRMAAMEISPDQASELDVIHSFYLEDTIFAFSHRLHKLSTMEHPFRHVPVRHEVSVPGNIYHSLEQLLGTFDTDIKVHLINSSVSEMNDPNSHLPDLGYRLVEGISFTKEWLGKCLPEVEEKSTKHPALTWNTYSISGWLNMEFLVSMDGKCAALSNTIDGPVNRYWLESDFI